jgi:hypothetical protein
LVQVKLWQPATPEANQWTAVATIKLSDAATAVDFVQYGESLLLAVGTDSGEISLYAITSSAKVTALELLKLDSR